MSAFGIAASSAVVIVSRQDLQVSGGLRPPIGFAKCLRRRNKGPAISTQAEAVAAQRQGQNPASSRSRARGFLLSPALPTLPRVSGRHRKSTRYLEAIQSRTIPDLQAGTPDSRGSGCPRRLASFRVPLTSSVAEAQDRLRWNERPDRRFLQQSQVHTLQLSTKRSS